ncbi:MAG: alpha/beta hydrolase [Gemmatimonadota bacterium]
MTRPIAATILLLLAAGIPADAATQHGQSHVQRIAVAHGDTIAVSSAGTGPAVLIVPGLLGSRHGFRHVTASLVANGHRVIVLDPLGTGRSSRRRESDYSLEAQATRIAAVMDSLAMDSAVLICHSVAGSMCYRLGLLDAARVRGIVAVNAGPDERASTPGLRMAMRFAPLIRLIGGAGSARGRTRGGLRESSVDPSWVTDEVVEAYTRPFGDMDAAFDALGGMAAARDTVPLLPRLRLLDVPVLLLVGAADMSGVTKQDEIEQLRAIPDFTVVRVDGAGAYIQEERPSAILDAVRALADRTAPGAS